MTTKAITTVAVSVSIVFLSLFCSSVVNGQSNIRSGVGVSARMPVTSSLSVSLYRLSDNTPTGSEVISFPVQATYASSFAALANEYMALSVNDNAISWRLRVITQNFDVAPGTTTGYGRQYGGLISTAPAVAPMGWQCSMATQSLSPGSPVNSKTNGWTFVKDLCDYGDKETNTVSQSFADSDVNGYTNVAFGGAAFTRVVCPNAPDGGVSLVDPKKTFYLYFEADFSGKPCGSYSGNIIVELINQ